MYAVILCFILQLFESLDRHIRCVWIRSDVGQTPFLLFPQKENRQETAKWIHFGFRCVCVLFLNTHCNMRALLYFMQTFLAKKIFTWEIITIALVFGVDRKWILYENGCVTESHKLSSKCGLLIRQCLTLLLFHYFHYFTWHFFILFFSLP